MGAMGPAGPQKHQGLEVADQALDLGVLAM